MFALLFEREMHRNMGGKGMERDPHFTKVHPGITNSAVTDSGSEGLPAQHTCQSSHTSGVSLPASLTLIAILTPPVC